MTIDLHPEALAELGEHAEWYETRREGLGTELMTEVWGTLDRIVEQPAIGATWPRLPMVRRLALASFPFTLVYFVEGAALLVVAVAHTSRRPGYWIDRLLQPPG